MPRIDVHRRNIDFKFRRNFLEIEAADAVRRETHARLEFGGNHSEYSPTFKVNFSEPTTMRADFDPGSGRISKSTRSSVPAFSANGLSGPGIYERQTPFLRSIGTRTPPSRNLSFEARVVHRQNVP